MRNCRPFSLTLLALLTIGSGWAISPQTNNARDSASPKTAPPPAQSATTEPDNADSTASQPLELTDQVVRDILSPLQRGLEAHDRNEVLGIFDRQAMSDYPDVRDQLVAFFARYDVIQFRYQVLQAVADKNHGFATADVDMDATPENDSQVPLRRTWQMRFQIRLGPKGWKVTAFKPGDLFTQ